MENQIRDFVQRKIQGNREMYGKKYKFEMDKPTLLCYNQLCMKISKMPCQG